MRTTKIFNFILILFLLTGISYSQSVSNTIPSSNAVNIQRHQAIQVVFTDMIVDSTLNNNSVIVYGTISGRHTGNISYLSNEKKLIYVPNNIFASGERVIVTLTNKIKKIPYIPLTPRYSFEFFVKADTGFNYMGFTKYQEPGDLYDVRDMRVVDIDSDGDFDLIFPIRVFNPDGDKIFIYKNDGNANFQSSYSYLVTTDNNYNHPNKILISDFNDDGKPDVAILLIDHISILTNIGDGQLNHWADIDIYNSVVFSCADFDNDSKSDIVGFELFDNSQPFIRKICFLKNLGNGTFEKIYSQQFSDNWEWSFYMDNGDINNDGFVDIVLSRRSPNQVFLLKNDGNGIFSSQSTIDFSYWPMSLVLGNFDNDTDLDLAVSTTTGSWDGFRVYKNTGNFNFNYFDGFYMHSHPTNSICSDFNNDGNLDVAVPYGYGGRVAVYLGNGDLVFNDSFVHQYFLIPDNSPKYVANADFDNDGDVDIIVLSDDVLGKIYFLENGAHQPVVPVELTGFSAMYLKPSIQLSWATKTELNNHGFEIQRSFDKSNWSTIGFIQGKGTTTEPQVYSFSENISETAANKLFYRLKQVDYNGTFEYSDIVEVGIVPQAFALNQNYPNPFNPSTKISWQTPVSGWQTLKVYDVLGNEVATLVNEEKLAGSYEITFDAGKLSSGVYYYQLRAGEFVETKQMILLK